MEIKSLIFTPAGKNYRDVYQYSHSIECTAERSIKLYENLNDEVDEVTETMIVNNIHDLITLTPKPDSKVFLPNGWDSDRVLFKMEIEIVTGNHSMIFIVQGYSDGNNKTNDGTVDPKMDFFINAVTEIHRFKDVSGKTYTRLGKTYNIITCHKEGTKDKVSYFEDCGFKVIRPTDVFSELHMLSTYGRSVCDNIIDARQFPPINTVRGNNDGLTYITKILNSFTDSIVMTKDDLDEDNVFMNAEMLTSENNIVNNAFSDTWSMLTNVPCSTSFNLETLRNFDSCIDNKITMVDTLDNRLDDCNITCLSDNSPEMKAAVTMTHSLSTYMSENMLETMDFSFTNIGNVNIVNYIHEVKSIIDGIDIEESICNVKTKIENILLKVISNNGEVYVDGTVHVNMLKDTTITISINKQPYVNVRFPTFADSLYSPVIIDNDGYQTITEELGRVLDILDTIFR